MRFWTLNCVIPHFHIADDYYYNKAEWTLLKVAFLVFVLVVATNEFAKNTIFVQNLINIKQKIIIDFIISIKFDVQQFKTSWISISQKEKTMLLCVCFCVF